MNTGDLVFFFSEHACHTGSWLEYIVSWFRRKPKPCAHVGMVLVNPKFLGLKGMYLWRADFWGEVAIEPIVDPANVKWCWVRKYTGERPFDMGVVESVFRATNRQTDPMVWINELIGPDVFVPMRYNAYWCSAFIGCVLHKMGTRGLKWDVMNPTYLAEIKMNNYTV